jgi:hypothetical protein
MNKRLLICSLGGLSLVIFVSVVLRYLFFETPDDFFRRQSKYEMYGFKLNDFRAKNGIPIIKDGWFTRNTSVVRVKGGKFTRNPTTHTSWAYQIWSDFDDSTKLKPYHKEKEIHIFPIRYEVDRFRKQENDTIEYLLEIKFIYDTSDSNERWSCSWIKISNLKADYLQEDRQLSLYQSDSILYSWGLSRYK